MVNLSGWEIMFVFCVGLTLIYLEFYATLFGFFGLAGLAALAFSLFLFISEGIQPSPLVLTMMGGTFLCFVILLLRLPKSQLRRKLSRSTSVESRDEDEPLALNELLGGKGIALSPLCPVGRVLIRGREVIVIAKDGYIVPETPVKVVGIEDGRVVVEEDFS